MVHTFNITLSKQMILKEQKLTKLRSNTKIMEYKNTDLKYEKICNERVVSLVLSLTSLSSFLAPAQMHWSLKIGGHQKYICVIPRWLEIKQFIHFIGGTNTRLGHVSHPSDTSNRSRAVGDKDSSSSAASAQ